MAHMAQVDIAGHHTAHPQPRPPHRLVGDNTLPQRLYSHAKEIICQTEWSISAKTINGIFPAALHWPGNATSEQQTVSKMSNMVDALCEAVNDLAGLNINTGFASQPCEIQGGVQPDLAFAFAPTRRELVNFEAKKAVWLERMDTWARNQAVYTDEGVAIIWNTARASNQEWSIIMKLAMAMTWKAMQWGILYGGISLAILEMRTSTNGFQYLAILPFINISSDGTSNHPPVFPTLLGLFLDASNAHHLDPLAQQIDINITDIPYNPLNPYLGPIQPDVITQQNWEHFITQHCNQAPNWSQIMINVKFNLPNFQSMPMSI
ncbi:hypothetical protein FRB95_003857 [Tulasnella sp. JGI-2019a]|nr:hypothetical protein FRB95_003857 [Tulasnella sp. JGI-2019a]